MSRVGCVVAMTMLTGACGGADEGANAGPAAAAFVAPLGADILLATISTGSDGLPSIGAPTNLTQRPDYDNQPFFTPDGTGIWYTVNDPHDGQADIWRYDLANGSVTRVTMSNPESEYSATPLPDGSGISTIRVEADSTQRLWRFDADGANAAVLVPGVAPVGYHAWSGESTVIAFVLGTPATLQRIDVPSGRSETLASDIGRSIQSIPGSDDVSYVQLNDDDTSTIMRLPDDGGPAVAIADAVAGGDYHAWTPAGVLLMADGPIVYAWRESAGWTPVADYTDLHILISRLAVSPQGTQIAMVAEIDPIVLPSG